MYFDYTFGEIEFGALEWSISEKSGESVFESIKIESHKCTREELGLTGDHSKFMKIQDKGSNLIEKHSNYL